MPPTSISRTAGAANDATVAVARLSPQDKDELLSLSTDLVQLALDLAGIVDPTPACDGASALISLARGQWFDALISGASMLPYVGDLAKAGKLPKYLRSVERAVALAQRSADAARALLPSMKKLDEVLAMLPEGASAQVDRIRLTVRKFINNAGSLASNGAVRHLPDISKHFKFPPLYRSGTGKYWVKEASGRLGIPGTVKAHRSASAQRRVSRGSGDDAGHLIGAPFGAPPGPRNLSRQNWIANQGGGTWHDLESMWTAKLQSGTGIEVRVREFIPNDEMIKGVQARPAWRKVEWTEFHPDGTRTTHRLDFVNTHTADAPHRAGSRTSQGIPATVAPGNRATIHHLFID